MLIKLLTNLGQMYIMRVSLKCKHLIKWCKMVL